MRVFITVIRNGKGIFTYGNYRDKNKIWTDSWYTKRRLHRIPRRSVRKAAGRRKTILPAGRAGVLGGGRNCGIELTRSWWAGLSSELLGGAQNLYELNLFAMRLTMLTSVELLSMDGLLKMEQARGTKSIPIRAA